MKYRDKGLSFWKVYITMWSAVDDAFGPDRSAIWARGKQTAIWNFLPQIKTNRDLAIWHFLTGIKTNVTRLTFFDNIFPATPGTRVRLENILNIKIRASTERVLVLKFGKGSKFLNQSRSR